MTKIEMLFIRACKSKNPTIRVKSVYRRFYLSGEHRNNYIASILSDIIEEYNLLNFHVMINALSPGNIWKYRELTKDYDILGFNPTISYNNEEYWTIVMNIFISTLRLTDTSKFPDLIRMKTFR